MHIRNYNPETVIGALRTPSRLEVKNECRTTLKELRRRKGVVFIRIIMIDISVVAYELGRDSFDT